MINVRTSAKILKNIVCAKDYSWHSTTCSCESGEYLAITIVDSVITCDEIIDTEDSVLTNVSCTVSTNAANIVSANFDDKKIRYKMNFFYFTSGFISGHITTYNRFNFLSLRKTYVKT